MHQGGLTVRTGDMGKAEAAISRLLRLAEAAGLAGVTEGMSYGTPGLRVRGRFLARLRDDDTLVVRCEQDEKDLLIAAEPEFYFQTDHYIGYPALLIRLDVIDDARLTARLEGAWIVQAGARAVRARRPNEP